MNKKNAIFTVLACVVCSAIAFVVGINISSNKGNGEDEMVTSPESQIIPDENDEKNYYGIYIANSSDGEIKLYLNSDHSCKMSHSNRDGLCKWRKDDKTLVIVDGGYYWPHPSGTVCEERKKWVDDNKEDGAIYYTKEEMKNVDYFKEYASENYECAEYHPSVFKYDILHVGAISGPIGSSYQRTYYIARQD